MQAACFGAAYGGCNSLVISAPTGCGKTCVLELALTRFLLDRGKEDSKAVYGSVILHANCP